LPASTLPQKEVAAIIFDLDGTLIDSLEVYYQDLNITQIMRESLFTLGLAPTTSKLQDSRFIMYKYIMHLVPHPKSGGEPKNVFGF